MLNILLSCIIKNSAITAQKVIIFSDGGHLEWRSGLLKLYLKRDHPRPIPNRFSFREDVLNEKTHS
jgi:hypothetical protein